MFVLDPKVFEVLYFRWGVQSYRGFYLFFFSFFLVVYLYLGFDGTPVYSDQVSLSSFLIPGHTPDMDFDGYGTQGVDNLRRTFDLPY